MLITNPLEIELTTKCTLGCPACPRNDTEEKKENWDGDPSHGVNLLKLFKDTQTSGWNVNGDKAQRKDG